MPTENDDPNRSVAFALQRTFYELQNRSVLKRNFTFLCVSDFLFRSLDFAERHFLLFTLAKQVK